MVAKRRAVKKQAPAKAARRLTPLQQRTLNNERLQADIARYETYEGPRQYAVPTYTPVRQGRTASGKPRIVGYRNTVTGEVVSSHYRFQVFGKYFKSAAGEQYKQTNNRLRRQRIVRHYNLIESYRLLHPDLTTNQIAADRTFQGLVEELEGFSAQQRFANSQFVHDELEEVTDASEDEIEVVQSNLRIQSGYNPRYQEVLVLLGRRLPSDTNPVGESDPNHIKNTVVPFYQVREGAVEFSEE